MRLDRDLQIQPDIADRWDISPDGLTYTFHLNLDATFHDGRPVVAEDFKLSWERALNPETASVVAENFLGDIVGARDLSRGRADAVSGIEVVDDSTLRVTIDAAKPYFIYKMAYTTAFVVDTRQVEANLAAGRRSPTAPVRTSSVNGSSANGSFSTHTRGTTSARPSSAPCGSSSKEDRRSSSIRTATSTSPASASMTSRASRIPATT